MLKFKLTLVLCALIFLVKSQPWTGMTTYPYINSDVNLSAGKPAFINNTTGFILAGYVPNLIGPGFNFYIDRTDDAGLITGPSSFQQHYALSTAGQQPNCFSGLAQETLCFGVSLVETNVPAGPGPTAISYAVAASFISGLLFSGIDATGAVSTSAFYPFPTGATHPTQPQITESVFYPGSYYICGAYVIGSSYSMYAMRVDATGSAIWSNTYDLGFGTLMEPKAIVEAPSVFSGPAPTLMVVGTAKVGTTNDAFYMSIDDTSFGNIVNYFVLYYGSTSSDEEFHSIEIAPYGGGYIVGGYTNASPSNGSAWMLLMNPATPGLPYWNNTINSATSHSMSSGFAGVTERYSSTYGHQEYYGTLVYNDALMPVGIMVLKLDDTGAPFSKPGNVHNEFYYLTNHLLSGSNLLQAVAISYDNTGGSNREGIHIYGTQPNGSGGVESCFFRSTFNGKAGTACSLDTVMNGVFAGPTTTNAAVGVSVNSGLMSCSNYNFTNIPLTYSISSFCSNTSMPAGGINSRSVILGVKTNAENAGIRVLPNPANDKLELSFTAVEQGKLTIDMYNSLGQLAKHLYTGAMEPGDQQVNLDLSEFEASNGIYFLHISLNGIVYEHKIIYNK